MYQLVAGSCPGEGQRSQGREQWERHEEQIEARHGDGEHQGPRGHREEGQRERGDAAGQRVSALGAGTCASKPWTTCAVETREAHNSGLRISRWAKAGTAMAFTSSGSTKSRRRSAASARASLSKASVPRGDAPRATRRSARVACTRFTM